MAYVVAAFGLLALIVGLLYAGKKWGWWERDAEVLRDSQGKHAEAERILSRSPPTGPRLARWLRKQRGK